MNFIRTWLWQQIDLGSFDSRSTIWTFALKVSFRSVILSSLSALCALPALYALGIIALPVEQVVKLTVAFSWLFGGALSGALAFVAGHVIRDLTLSRAEFERLSRTDTLSGLYNRRAFNDALSRVEEEASLAIIDIDRFKGINDRFGHTAGDVVIQSISTLLRDVFGERNLVARLGGEEFGVILRGGGIAQRLALVERARSLVSSQTFYCQGVALAVTISAGVAEFHPGRRAECVYARADQALYCAKNDGRDRVLHEQSLAFVDEPPEDLQIQDGPHFGVLSLRS